MEQFLKEIILEAGQMTLDFRARLDKLAVRRKMDKDLVSEADVAVEDFLVSRIQKRYPDHAIFGEESGQHTGGQYRWIIDPIDGTTSFVHGQPYYSISIALEQAQNTILAAVNAPALGELYTARLGHGAFVNGSPIHVSPRSRLSDSVMATGFACIRRHSGFTNLPIFNRMTPILRDVRRYGSAAVDLCYTACGRLEGFWEMDLKIYDVAAGALILHEAGGRCTDFSGGSARLYNEVLGTNGHIHTEAMGVIAGVIEGIDKKNKAP
ncbi:MAG: inositol monophosphatase [Sedimentisphaerales bacterium]|nr:inositol monophosphatase [Sedimentisphaerales bacterium]